MRVRAIRHINDPQPVVVEASTIVIETSAGDPVAIAMEVSGDLRVFVTAEDPEFNRYLKALGIDRTVITTDLGKNLVPENRPHRLPSLLGD